MKRTVSLIEREKTYVGRRIPSGLVVAVREGGGRDRPLHRNLRHHVRHSPTGFNCGYGGSGPADLARCILIDYLDLHDNPDALNADYQQFKFDVIAGLDPSGFELPASRVEEWLSARIDEAMAAQETSPD